MTSFVDSEEYARGRDAADPLRGFRDQFAVPVHEGRESIYLCGNSLGLLPRAARQALTDELDAWASLAVDGHFKPEHPWYTYHRELAESGARLIGGEPGEVVFMNGLTVNLHLMLVSFFRPAGERRKILIESGAFPSDRYAVQTQLEYHGLDPGTDLIEVPPPSGSANVGTDEVIAAIERDGPSIALVLLGGVNYFTGQLLDMEAIARKGREAGCLVGFDLAHSVGNVEHRLHDWGVDFAVWCTYKYLNAGPGSVAGCFVHAGHCRDTSLPQFGGWWGNDPDTRFAMNTVRDFVPVPGADRWQLSNPPILALAPLRESLRIFDAAGMKAVRSKSVDLTGYLEFLVDSVARDHVRIITPSDPAERGAQLSLAAGNNARALFERLHRGGVIADFREPDVIRVAPAPLYNSYHDVWRFARILADATGSADG